MTVGERSTVRRQTTDLAGCNIRQLEAALLIQRSAKGAELLASLAEASLDVATIARISRDAINGDLDARYRLSTLDHNIVFSMCRVLCLSGNQRDFDRSIDILAALASELSSPKVRPIYRTLLPEALIYQGRYPEAAEYLSTTSFDPTQDRRFGLAIHNPFREGNGLAWDTPDWLSLLNSYVSPSGELSPISLDSRLGDLPFDQLWGTPTRRVDGPLVTVVMSSFRSDATIYGAVQSILNQTWTALELLVIDDASGPRFDALYERVEAMDPRIRVVRLPVNGGTYLARNRALTLARGEFITFQDSDDWSHPERIERQVKALLNDKSLIATQSSCFRTDDYLDPVQVSYPTQLRRNESSLLFRTRIIRRVGFFHYTRKGGDSEYRLRLEAAFNRPTPIIGDEPLAIVRLTPGSLSRNEFSPGFRHPRRLIYSKGFELVHERAVESQSFYRPLREYRDNFVPPTFQPRIQTPDETVLDVIVVADIRTCGHSEDWILSTVEALRACGLEIGLAHSSGIRYLNKRVDQIAPEVSALFVDGIVRPVDFGEKRIARCAVVADAALMQSRPWSALSWSIGRVFVRRVFEPVGTEVPYDDATVAFNCLQLMGQRPVWMAPESRVVERVVKYVRSNSTARYKPEPLSNAIVSNCELDAYEYGSYNDGPLWCRLNLDQNMVPGHDHAGLLEHPQGVPVYYARDVESGKWCAVVGWPIIGYEHRLLLADLARHLLTSWIYSSAHFENRFSDIGGHCIVLRGERDELCVRATCGEVKVTYGGHFVQVDFQSDVSGQEWDSVEDCVETIINTRDQTSYDTRVPAEVEYEGSPLAELSQIVDWEISGSCRDDYRVVLDDDWNSALWIGFFRDRIDDYELIVRAPKGRVERFLQEQHIQYSTSVYGSTHIRQLPAIGSSSGNQLRCSPSHHSHLGRSLRARALKRVIAGTMSKQDILDGLWPSLGQVLVPVRADQELQGLSSNYVEADTRKRLALKVLCEAAGELSDFEVGRAYSLFFRPDLSLNELLPLKSLFVRGRNRTLVVTMSLSGSLTLDGIGEICGRGSSDCDHHLVIEDTSNLAETSPSTVRFIGNWQDDLVRRWSRTVREFASAFECRDIVVRGEGLAAVPAIRLASYIGGSTVAYVNEIRVLSKHDEEGIINELESDFGTDDTLASQRDMLRERYVLSAIMRVAPQSLRVVVQDIRDHSELPAWSGLLSSDDRIVFGNPSAFRRFAFVSATDAMEETRK